MAYVEGRVVHDADSHIMEAPNFLDGYVEERYAESIRRKHMFSLLGEKSGKDLFAVVRGRHDDPKWRAEAADQILLRKNYEALGSWRREDRPSALDSLGFASQLMFTTMFLGLLNLEHEGDPVMRNAVARGFNRAMVDFCAVDRRLLASCYVPLADFDEAAAISRDAISIGAKALLIPSRCPQGTFAESHRIRSGVGAGAGGRVADSVPRRRRRTTSFKGLLRQRAATGSGFSWRRRQLPFSRLHGDSVSADADAVDDDLRSGA